MKNYIIYIIALLNLQPLISMTIDTTYLNSSFEKTIKDSCEYIKIVQKDEKGGAVSRTYYKSGQILNEINYSYYDKNIWDGSFRLWHSNGKLKKEMMFKDGKAFGQRKIYNTRGNLIRLDYYENDTIKSSTCYTPKGKLDECVDLNDYMSEYPGGNDALYNFLVKNLKYPRKARKNSIVGKVVLSFRIDTEGKIFDIIIKQSINPILDKEAIRVVNKLEDFIPAYQDGEPVISSYILPIKFDL